MKLERQYVRKCVILTLIASGIMVSCSKNEPVQTAQWYKEHAKERLEVLNKCRNNPGELASTPNCVNANTAAQEIIWHSRKGMVLKPLKFK